MKSFHGKDTKLQSSFHALMSSRDLTFTSREIEFPKENPVKGIEVQIRRLPKTGFVATSSTLCCVVSSQNRGFCPRDWGFFWLSLNDFCQISSGECISFCSIADTSRRNSFLCFRILTASGFRHFASMGMSTNA
jgi:hypothetical protein